MTNNEAAYTPSADLVARVMEDMLAMGVPASELPSPEHILETLARDPRELDRQIATALAMSFDQHATLQ